jgi:hypothetical protein
VFAGGAGVRLREKKETIYEPFQECGYCGGGTAAAGGVRRFELCAGKIY